MKLSFCIMCGWVFVLTWDKPSTASPLNPLTMETVLTLAPELTTTVNMTLSKQPSKVLEAALGSKLQGVSAYAVRFCNPSFSPAIISGGMAAQVIEKQGLAVVAIELATIAARSARTHSHLYALAKWTTNAAYYASLTTNGFVPTSSIAARVIPVIMAHEASLARERLEKELPDPTVRFKGLVLTDEDILLPAGVCKTLLFMGTDLPGFVSMSTELQVRRGALQ